MYHLEKEVSVKMCAVKLLTLWFLLALAPGGVFSTSNCLRSETTSQKRVRVADDYGWFHDRIDTKTESEKYNCWQTVFPMKSFPDHCSDCVSNLTITSLKQKTVPPLSFSECNYFQVIRMENVGIEAILPAAFNSLTQLKELYMSNNQISKLPDGLMSSLSSLEIIDISFNQLENITEHSLIGLKNLKLLNLSQNHLQHFDTSFTYITGRVEIDLSFHLLNSFNFENITEKIQKLNLSHNAIAEISGCFSMIEILRLEHNKLTTIKNNTCDGSSKITELDLGHNVISELSINAFKSISTLHYLYLENNNLTSLHAGIFSGLDNLHRLNLSGNHLKDFQHGVFQHLLNLQSLDLSRNDLTVIKRYFHSLPIQELYLGYNHLNNVDFVELHSDLPMLKTLSLEGNNLPCEQLINVQQNMNEKRITLLRGSTILSDNVHGIACNESKKNGEVDKGAAMCDEKCFTGIYQFFNDGFKDTNLYKYLESFHQEPVLKINQTEIFKFFEKDFKNSRLFDEFNHSFPSENNMDKYRNEDLEIYLNKSQALDNFLHDTFNKSIFYNFFNDDFLKSEFYQYFYRVVQNSQVDVTPNELEKPKVGKFVSNRDTLHENFNSYLLALVCLLVVLIFIGLILMFMIVKFYFAFIKMQCNHKDRIELIDS